MAISHLSLLRLLRVTFPLILFRVVGGQEGKYIDVDSSLTFDLRKTVENESIELAAHLFAKSRSSANADSNPIFEEVGSGPEGGRLLRLRDSVPNDAGDEKQRLLKSSKKEKKSPKKTKDPKKIKSPKKNKSQKNRCTHLVAEGGNWKTWDGSVATFAPIFRPATDRELMKIIKHSKKYDCTVRTMGARHTQDGMVMQRTEEDFVVISLASHSTQVEGWGDSINRETSTFRIGAGKSWYDVSALIRPHGFVQLSRTTAQYFSIGGVIANMVHGGGRSTGFIHDDVVKLLVMTSDGEIKEVEGDDLDYWRSSAGLLGFILAVEMKMHSEEIPFVAGINPATGAPIMDLTKGGLKMEREKTAFPRPANTDDFIQLLSNLTQKVFETSAMYDNVQFFYDFYNNVLGEYRTSFAGERFSGTNGDFADVEKAEAYRSSSQAEAELNSGTSFTGGPRVDLSVEALCETFCVPPSGPISIGGNGSQCIRIPSEMIPEADLCSVPLEVNAALSISAQQTLDHAWDAGSSCSNDGYFHFDSATPSFDTLIAFVPARAFPSAFSAWYEITSKATLDELENISFYPNGNLEFRFVNPSKTAVLNPIPPIDEIKAEFDLKYNAIFQGVPSAYDLFLPPLPPGVPDGYVAIEFVNLRGVFGNDVSKYMSALQNAWSNMPMNPLLPYAQGVVPDCDPSDGILPCQGSPPEGTQCCNPSIPTKLVHFGKGWGYAIDPQTTPITNKLVPFTDAETIAKMYSTGTKQTSISDFNKKRSELKAEVFSGGSMLRWLEPANQDSKFEVRKLDGQMCGSPEFTTDPNVECINNQCVNSVCQ